MQSRRRHGERTTGRLGRMHEARVEKAHQEVSAARSGVRRESSPRLQLEHGAVPAGKRVVEAEGVNMRWGEEQPWLWPEPGIHLRLVGPERIALTGPSGGGKSTLARLLVGELEPTRGRVYRAELPVAWLDQRCRLLAEGVPLLDALRRGDPSIPERQVYWSLDRFGLGRAAAPRHAETLSGGERMRAALASLFAVGEPPGLLVLDEPTNNLDLDTVEVLEETLAAYRGALVLISHDADFVEAVGVRRRLRLDGVRTRVRAW